MVKKILITIYADQFSTLADQEKFFEVLGSGTPESVPEEDSAEDDATFEANHADGVTLYKVSDASGSLLVESISTRPIKQEMLKTEDCFILDTESALYVWVGKGATKQEKTQAISRAESICPQFSKKSLNY